MIYRKHKVSEEDAYGLEKPGTKARGGGEPGTEATEVKVSIHYGCAKELWGLLLG